MKNFRSIALGLAGLVLLSAPALFAQSSPAPAAAPSWAAAHKHMQIAYDAFIQAASHDDLGKDGANFNTQMHSLLDATDGIHQAQASLASQSGAAYREIFAKTVVMCQRSAIMFWQQNAQMDRSPGHFYQPPPTDVAACSKKLAEPDPVSNDH